MSEIGSVLEYDGKPYCQEKMQANFENCQNEYDKHLNDILKLCTKYGVDISDQDESPAGARAFIHRYVLNLRESIIATEKPRRSEFWKEGVDATDWEKLEWAYSDFREHLGAAHAFERCLEPERIKKSHYISVCKA